MEHYYILYLKSPSYNVILTKGFWITVLTPPALAMLEPDQRESPNLHSSLRVPSNSRKGMPHSWSRTTSKGLWDMMEKTVERLSICLILRVLSVDIVKLYDMVIICVFLMIL